MQRHAWLVWDACATFRQSADSPDTPRTQAAANEAIPDVCYTTLGLETSDCG